MDYNDTICKKHNNDSFKNRTEIIQHKVSIAITGAIQGTSKQHLYQELGL